MSKLTDRLAKALRVHNELNFLALAEPAVWIDYSHGISGSMGYIDRCATVRYSRDGKRYKAEFRAPEVRNAHEERRACIEQAQKAASERFGVTEWVRLPFPGSWAFVPRDAYDRVMARLEAAEGSQA